MDRAKENGVGPDCEKLNGKTKEDYDEKVRGAEGLNPYEHPQWSAGVNQVPNFKQPNI